MIRNYNLSYQVGTVNWDGKYVQKIDDGMFLPTFKTLKSVGINEVMLSGYVTVEEAAFDMDEETKRIGGLLDSMGMRPAQHHGLSAMFAAEGKSQDSTIEKLIKSVRYTANMNSPVLVIHPGHVDLHFQTLEEYDKYFHEQMRRMGRKDFMRLCASNLDAAGDAAGKLGVKIAIENVHLFDSDITLMKDLLAEVKSPNVGFCLDSGHAHYKCPEVMDWMEAFGDRLVTTHFHDNRGNNDEHLPPGFGTIPWIDVIQGLRRHNYENTVNFESGGWDGMDMAEGYKAAINFWRTCEYYASKA